MKEESMGFPVLGRPDTERIPQGSPRNGEGRPKAALASQTKENRDSEESRGSARTEGGGAWGSIT